MALDGAIRPKKASSGGIVVYDSVTDTTYRDGVPIDDGRDAAPKRETADGNRTCDRALKPECLSNGIEDKSAGRNRIVGILVGHREIIEN